MNCQGRWGETLTRAVQYVYPGCTPGGSERQMSTATYICRCLAHSHKQRRREALWEKTRQSHLCPWQAKGFLSGIVFQLSCCVLATSYSSILSQKRERSKSCLRRVISKEQAWAADGRPSLPAVVSSSTGQVDPSHPWELRVRLHTECLPSEHSFP